MLTKFLITFLTLLALHPSALAHGDDKKKPPTKAKAQLMMARKQMDAAKMKLIQAGRYACCVKSAPGSKSPGCDMCAKMNGSCSCGASLGQGKGVCGDCLAGWKTGRGAIPGVDKMHVTLLDSSHQAMSQSPNDPITQSPDLAKAQETLNNAKRTLVKETRFSCCIGKGGCDECAYEASCPCAKEIIKGQQGEGICGQCFDGQHAGHGRIQGVDMASIKLSPMQEGMMNMESFAGIPMQREASGTSWQPDSTPMHAHHTMSGLWRVMQHYNLFLSYDNQSGPRGDDQLNALGWYMAMASRPMGKGELMLRAMLSPDPAGVGPKGYPLLFQNGEAYHGQPLVDRQHPHDFFMEVAARYRHAIDEKTAAFLYVAPSGEPALGPTAFPHRTSAMDNPAAPLTHHWQDSTHISFGVLTAGVSRGNWQLEGSYFNGREPNEHRWDFDRIKLDSYSGRLTYNPSPNWSLQGSYGWLKSPEELHPDETRRRSTISATYNRPMINGGNWATTLAWGRNNAKGINSDGFLMESNLNLANKNTLFGRFELVEKSMEDLNIPSSLGCPAPCGFDLARVKFKIAALTLGAIHELNPGRAFQTGLGASVTFNWKPRNYELNQAYGYDDPTGFWVFLRIRPAAMHQGDSHGHDMHEH
jgi:hypothetical protein